MALGTTEEKVYAWFEKNLKSFSTLSFFRETKNENFAEINLNNPVFDCDKNLLGVIDVKFNNQGKCSSYKMKAEFIKSP